MPDPNSTSEVVKKLSNEAVDAVQAVVKVAVDVPVETAKLALRKLQEAVAALESVVNNKDK